MSRITKEEIKNLLTEHLPEEQKTKVYEKIKEDEKYEYFRMLGQRRMKDGSIKNYFYTRKVEKVEKKKRGRKREDNKKELRDMLKKCNDQECMKIIDFIKNLRKDITVNEQEPK